MKRENITLYFFLALGLIAIISIYIANQSLKVTIKKAGEEKEKLQAQSQAQSLLRQGQGFPQSIIKKGKFKEENREEASAKKEKKEIELPQTTEDYIYTEEGATGAQEEAQAGEPQEAATTEEGNLEKQPSVTELKEPRGVIIY